MADNSVPTRLPPQKTKGTFVQTDRASHEAWAGLTRKSPLAAQLMHLLAARVGDHNAVVISQGTLAKLANASRRGVQKGLAILEQDRWIELVQVGDRGTVNAYVINDRVAWIKGREGLRYSLFSAIVVASDNEQPDQADLGNQPTLRRLPRMDERQLPSGDGLPPVSQPFLTGWSRTCPQRSGRTINAPAADPIIPAVALVDHLGRAIAAADRPNACPVRLLASLLLQVWPAKP